MRGCVCIVRLGWGRGGQGPGLVAQHRQGKGRLLTGVGRAVFVDGWGFGWTRVITPSDGLRSHHDRLYTCVYWSSGGEFRTGRGWSIAMTVE